MRSDLLDLIQSHSVIYAKDFNFKNRFKKQYNTFLRNVDGIKNIKSLGFKIGDSSIWIIDNFFMIENEIINILNEGYINIKKINSIKSGNEFIPRVYDFCLHVIENQVNVLEEKEFFEKLASYEQGVKLKLNEIWKIPFFLNYAILENIYKIVDEIFVIEKQKYKAYTLLSSVSKFISSGKLETVFKRLEILFHDNTSIYTIEHFIKLVRENKIEIKEINDFLDRVLLNKELSYEELENLNNNNLNEKRIKISMFINTLKNISLFNWRLGIENVSLIHNEFLKDPSNVYGNMDYESRDYYRKVFEKNCEKNNLDQYKEAVKIIKLCENGITNYSKHIGYYILDGGNDDFKRTNRLKKLKKLVYFMSIFVGIGFFGLLLFKYFKLNFDNVALCLSITFLFLVFVSDIWINFVNYVFLNRIESNFIPKMDYSKGIPEEAKTVVVIPALLSSKEDIDNLFKNLEIAYICNKNDNLYFSLLFDYEDTISYEGSEDKILLTYAQKILDNLNNKYKNNVSETKFYMFIRNKIYSESNKIYMGWERKRGKIMEFIKFLKGRESGFNVSIENYPLLKNAKYILTIDSDTKLMKDTASKLVGTIHHILNRAVIKTVRRNDRVVRGYGIVQPRVNISFKSSLSTIYSKIFVGDVSTSSYNSISSNIYQDIFSEGIFIGKGIIDIDVFDKILWKAIPENRVLSHDLLEGTFARVLLSSDISIEEEFPSSILSSFSRIHRWTRGDWQLIPFLIKGKGISLLSKYKITDNLRRSLIPISYVICFVLPLFLNIKYLNIYYGLFLTGLIFPFVLDLSSLNLMKIYKRENFLKLDDLKNKLIQSFIVFSFIPYHAYIVCDAILRALFRIFVSKKNLLEWKPFNEVEKKSYNSIFLYFQKMFLCSVSGVLIILYGIYLKRYEIIIPSISYVLAPFIAFYLSKDYLRKRNGITSNQYTFLKVLSRSIFSYFEDFVNSSTNYLICDNYQVDPPIGVSAKTSPTNIGMSLSSFVIGRDFGFITIYSMIEKIKNILNSVDKLPTYKGHLYNWYDIEKFTILDKKYISTVDSGNLLASYYLCKKSLEDILNKPLIHKELVKSFDEMGLLSNNFKEDHLYKDVVKLGYKCSDYVEYIKFLEKMDEVSKKNIVDLSKENIDVYWHIKINEISKSFLDEILNITCNIHKIPNFNVRSIGNIGKIFASKNIGDLEKELIILKNEYNNSFVRSEEVDLKISQIIKNVKDIVKDIHSLIDRINLKINAMDFKFLYNKSRELFFIGYYCDNDTLDENCYDLLASEVRIASFLAIAKGDVPISHWFKLGRLGVNLNGVNTLISWSGTMFEYLMPMLYMKAYPETLFYDTYRGCVGSQIKFAHHNKIPFGLSESCFYEFDEYLNYQYKAFGVPNISIKKDYENLVVSPYSSIMSSMVDFRSSIKNLFGLKKLGAFGKYGFFEAVDFTKSRVQNEKYSIVKIYMAHHQGMSFIALSNILMDGICQNRFEEIIELESISELLSESVSNISIRTIKENKYVSESLVFTDEFVPRFINCDKNKMFEMQIYSNKNYFLGISSNGGGYLKFKDCYISNLNRDFTNENIYGSIYIKDLEKEEFFSNTYLPCKRNDLDYTCEFELNKARFKVKNKDLKVSSEIFISSDDNVEIRKITLNNLINSSRNIELTSYFESDILNCNFDYINNKLSLVCGNNEENLFVGHSVFNFNSDIKDVEFENNKDNFIGFGGSLQYPVCMGVNSNYGYNQVCDKDVIMSLKVKINLKSYGSSSIYFINALGSEKQEVIKLLDKYKNLNIISNLYNSNSYDLRLMANKLNISSLELSLFNYMTSKIIYGFVDKKYDIDNYLSINDLISHNIDPKIPMVAVEIGTSEDLKNVELLIKAFVYFSNFNFNFNLIFLNTYVRNDKCIEDEIDKLVLKYNLFDKLNVDNGLYMILSNFYKNAYEIIKNIANVFIKSGDEDIYDQLGFEVGTYKEISDDNKDYKNLFLPKQESAFEVNRNFIFRRYLFETPNEIFDYDDVDKYSIPKRALKFYNSYGGFSKDYFEYVIKLNDFNITPNSYRNILGNDYIFTNISSNGCMNTWAFDCKEFFITDTFDKNHDYGESIYIKEDDFIWSPMFMPVSDGEDYIVSNSPFSTKVENKYREIKTTTECFIPKDKKYKVLKISFKNFSDTTRNIDLYYFAPLLLSSKGDYSKRLSTYINRDFGYIYGENNFSKNFKNIKGYLKMFGCDSYSFTGSKREFLGINQGYFNPLGVNKNKLSNLTGVYLEACLCTSGKITINEGETKDVYVVLGYDNSIEGINLEISSLNRDLSLFDKMYNERKNDILNRYRIFKIKTQDEYMDIFLNGWIFNQATNEKFLLSNSSEGELNSCINLIEKCLIYNYTNPSESKKNIIKVFSNMYENGSFKDNWSYLLREYKNNDSLYDSLWIMYVLIDYIKITDDLEILDFKIKYLSDNAIDKSSKMVFSSIYEKCLLILNRFLCMDMMGTFNVNENIVDVKVLFMFYKVLVDFDDIFLKFNDTKNRDIFSRIREDVLHILKNDCFNGEFFINSINDKFSDNFYNDIYLLPQVLCLNFIDDREICNKVIFCIDKYLVNKELGFVREFFRKDIKSFKTGENIQDSRTLILLSKALVRLNLHDKAYNYLKFLNPVLKTINRNYTNVYKNEPYIIPAKINFKGNGLMEVIKEDFNYVSPLFFRVILQDILGLHLFKDGFFIEPCIPNSWNTYVIEYKNKNSYYKIIVRRGVNKFFKVNGEKYVDNFIKFEDNGTYIIDISI